MLKKIGKLYEKHNTSINIMFAIITIASTIFAVYSYIHPINIDPKLTVIVDSQDNFLVKSEKRIPNLIITYKGEELGKNNLGLLVKRITITNTGRAPVRLQDYGQGDIKIKIFNGKLIATESLPEKNNRLLSLNIKPTIIDSVTISLSKQVFNPTEAVSFNAYILINPARSKNLDYYILGKIAGQDTIPFFFENELEQDTDWSGLFAFILIFAGFIVSLFLFVFVLDYISDFITKYVRKNYILKLYGFPLKELNDTQVVFVKIYKNLKKNDFLELMNGLANDSNYILEQEKICEAFKVINTARKKSIIDDTNYSFIKDLFYTNNLIKKENETITFISETLKEEAIKILKLIA